MADKLKILFLCTGNSCRSQMAEGWTRQLKNDRMEAFSAGIEPHGLDPRAVEVMAEAGVDISPHQSKSLNIYRDTHFDFVVTVCDHARETCPWFPGNARLIHAGFEDPPGMAMLYDDPEDKLDCYRKVRDQIKRFVTGMPENLTDERV